jgi:hypothetical protein
LIDYFALYEQRYAEWSEKGSKIQLKFSHFRYGLFSFYLGDSGQGDPKTLIVDVCFIYGFTLPNFMGIITASFKIGEDMVEWSHLSHNRDYGELL